MAKTPSYVLGHWSTLIEGLQTSPMDFYARVEQAIERRKIPDAKRSRVDYREGGLFSAKREYLRVQRFEYIFDICGAPFGSAFFVSWWLGELRGCIGDIAELPFVGPYLKFVFRRETYFRMDTADMFRTAVDAAVKEVVDEMIDAKGLRALGADERKPVLREFWQK